MDETTTKIIKIKNIQITQSREKSFANTRRRDLEFEVGSHVFPWVTPLKGVTKFGKRGKLNPHFIRSFEILEKIRAFAYRLALPLELSRVHNVFHISMLCKSNPNPSHVLS